MDDFFKGQYSKTKTVSETNERLNHIGIIEKHFLIRGNQLERDIPGNDGSYEAWIY